VKTKKRKPAFPTRHELFNEVAKLRAQVSDLVHQKQSAQTFLRSLRAVTAERNELRRVIRVGNINMADGQMLASRMDSIGRLLEEVSKAFGEIKPVIVAADEKQKEADLKAIDRLSEA
jgi:hypothetical protein